MNLTADSIVHEGDKVFYEYRGKGGKTGKRELPRPAYEAIVAALAAWGNDLATMSPSESLWPSAGSERGVTSGTFYGNLRRYSRRRASRCRVSTSSATQRRSSGATGASLSRM